MKNENNCEICRRLIREKYKYHKLWKILAIVFIILTILFSILFFVNGDLFKKEIHNENDIEISNEGDGDNINKVTINN